MEGSKSCHFGGQTLAARLTSSQNASLFIKNSVNRDTFILFQNIDHNIFCFGTCVSLPYAHFLVIINKL